MQAPRVNYAFFRRQEGFPGCKKKPRTLDILKNHLSKFSSNWLNVWREQARGQIYHAFFICT